MQLWWSCENFITDTKEVWHLEIVGAGKDEKGSVWVAQRVPDDHVSVCANASRIRKIDLSNPDYFMASKNIFKVAKKNGWWDPERDGERLPWHRKPALATDNAAFAAMFERDPEFRHDPIPPGRTAYPHTPIDETDVADVRHRLAIPA